MSDLADLFPGFASHWIDTSVGRMFARAGGSGPPLLCLHGYPQTHVMWHRVAPALARHFTLVLPDLPGYGWSAVPDAKADHAPYTKRAMADVMIAVQAQIIAFSQDYQLVMLFILVTIPLAIMIGSTKAALRAQAAPEHAVID